MHSIDLNFNKLKSLDFNKLSDKEKIDFIIENNHLPFVLNEHGQGPKVLDELKRIGKTPSDFYIAVKLYLYMPPNMYYTDKLKLIKANLALRKQLKLPSIFPHYELRFTNPKFDETGIVYNMHVEAGMQVEIVRLSQYPKTIATFNAFLTFEKNKRCMRINNIQGAGHNTFDFSQLTDTLKENWRIKIVKVINEICISKKIELIGELPKKFLPITPSSRYEKTVMQYLKTYLLGGIKPENIDATKVRDNEKKNPFELRIKIEKLITNREKNLLKTKKNQEKHIIRNLRKQKNGTHQKPIQKHL